MSLTAEQRDAVSIQTPEHLKRFLVQHDRRFIIIDSVELVDALSAALGWPMGAKWFQALTQYLKDHRMQSAPVDEGPCPKCNGATAARPAVADVCPTCWGAGRQLRARTDALEPEELRAARDWIDQQLAR